MICACCGLACQWWHVVLLRPCTLYRLSIKSFPDYKHLLQENYVGYIFFLLLLKLVSKMLCHVFIVMLQLRNLLVSKWRQWRRKSSVFCGITKQNRRLSIRLSPCNKRGTCWSVLMCCKKNFLGRVTFWKNIRALEL